MLDDTDHRDWRIDRRKIKRFRQPKRHRSRKPSEFVLRLFHRGAKISVGPGKRELRERDAAQVPFFRGQHFSREWLQPVKPNWLADADERDLRYTSRYTGPIRSDGERLSILRDEISNRVGKPMQALLELGPV